MLNKKICIVGTGWVGCHLATILTPEYDVELYSPEGRIFDSTSMYNQNRLHLGYHYARSHKTRELCYNTFQRFLNIYGHLTQRIDSNIYAVPCDNSLIDFQTYLKIFESHSHSIVSIPELTNIEGCIQVDERYIDPYAAKSYFEKKINKITKAQKITTEKLIDLSKKYDIVINCTNNLLNSDTNNTFWEQCVMLIYKIIKPCPFQALTLVDGPLFSIYPYTNNTVTLSHVLYTPFEKTLTPSFKKLVDIKDIQELMEKDVLKYFPNFFQYYKFDDYFTSIKAKRNIKCDDRTPVLSINNNIINCYTGKIQGIFYAEKFIKHELSNWR